MRCYELLFIVFQCCLVFFIVAHCCSLLFIVVQCFSVLFNVVLQQQSSQLGLYGAVLLRLLGNTGKYSKGDTEIRLFQNCPPGQEC